MSKFDTEVRLSREMSLLDATMIGVGAMIGAGIFVPIGIAAGVAGPALILAFIHKAALALVIFGIGWFVAAAASKALDNALQQEKVPKSSLVARLAKAVIIVVFSSMALVELDIARQIVIIGFTTIIVSVAVVSVALIVLGGKDLIGGMTESHKKDKPSEEYRHLST